MKIHTTVLLAMSVVAWVVGATSVSAAPFYGVADPHMGEFEGFWEAKNGTRGRVTAQVRPLANNRYDGFVILTRAQSPVAVFALKPSPLEGEKIAFATEPIAKDSDGSGDLLARTDARAELIKGKLSGSFSGELGEGTFEAEIRSTESQTMGAKPGANAIVLFDGKKLDGWKSANWPITEEGFLQVGKGNLVSKENLNNFKLHLEFRTPYMPVELGQARGNSGVYLQGKYEVQVLDSFGLYPLQDNDCGGIYRVQAPRVNACRPPMSWQTYDITFRENGRDGRPTITVVLNGTTVVEEAVVGKNLVQNGTGGGQPGGFLMLQDHGNAVQYRNIWAEPLP